MAKPAAVRFYVDEDTLGLARTLCELRSDVTFPGDPGGMTRFGTQRPPCPIQRGTPDPDWIRQVGSLGWVVLTRDGHIAERTAEINAVKSAGATVVVTSQEQLNNFEILEVVMCQWPRIEQLHGQPGPRIFSATRTTFNAFAI